MGDEAPGVIQLPFRYPTHLDQELSEPITHVRTIEHRYLVFTFSAVEYMKSQTFRLQ